MNYKEALKLATEKHKGQFRKLSGKEFITHPIAVADKFTDEDHKIVAVLHDIIEDTDTTLEELCDLGLDEKLIKYIDILTRKPNQSYLQYLLLVECYSITKSIKIEDLKHNLSDKPSSKCQEDKYIMALFLLDV